MILVDSHVHIHDCFDLQVFLDSALANFTKEAVRWGQEDTFMAFLLLTESQGENWFHRLKGGLQDRGTTPDKPISNWTFHRTQEDCSLLAQSVNTQGIHMVAGRQIVAAENLEVLALATTELFEDGDPLIEVIQAVKERGGIPVIPWGAGKWTGKRGEFLRAIIEKAEDSSLFLGDNGGRPSILPRPRLFQLAEERSIRVLPGSDPLPFRSEARCAGSFGFSIPRVVSTEHPGQDLKRILLDPKTSFRTYGRLEMPHRFLRNQLAMQIIKRRNRRKKAIT